MSEHGSAPIGPSNLPRTTAQDGAGDERVHGDGAPAGGGLVAVGGDQPSDDNAAVTDPADLVRIGTMVQTLANEIREMELDEAGRARLGDIHGRAVELVKEAVSDELSAELETLVPDFGEGVPSGAELRVAQAQLAGWLEGLFRGLQFAAMSQQLQAQARQGLQGGPPGAAPPSRVGGGTYL